MATEKRETKGEAGGGGVPAVRGGGDVVVRKFEGVETRPVNERATTMAAETARAMVQARFIVAQQRPRNELDVRERILNACRRTRFAAVARYRKPQGGAKSCGLPGCPHAKKAGREGKCHFVCGPSIRFADEAVKYMWNVDTRQDVLYDDDEQRIVQVTATDLETNLTKSQTVTIRKVIERKTPKDGQQILGERQNSKKELVFIVRAGDDEVNMKEANYCAKARRNLELQLVPQDVIEDATDEVLKTLMAEVKRDPQAALKAVCDGFATLNLLPSDLEKYLGHELAKSSPEEIQDLREIFTTIKDGQATWKEYLSGERADEKKPAGDDKLAAGRHDHSKKEPKAEEEKPSEEKPKEAPPAPAGDAPKPEIKVIEANGGGRDALGLASTKMLIMLAGGDKAKAKELLGEFCINAGIERVESFKSMTAPQALLVYTLIREEAGRLAKKQD